MDPRLGWISLAIFGLAVLWGTACALWIQSLLPSEAALPVMGLCYFGVLGLSAAGGICGLLGVALRRCRGWGAVMGLLLNVSPWLFLLWAFTRGNL